MADHRGWVSLKPTSAWVADGGLLRPLLAADQPQAPPELRAALRAIDQHIDADITRARLTPAA
jgi:hypothetical protein